MLLVLRLFVLSALHLPLINNLSNRSLRLRPWRPCGACLEACGALRLAQEEASNGRLAPERQIAYVFRALLDDRGLVLAL